MSFLERARESEQKMEPELLLLSQLAMQCWSELIAVVDAAHRERDIDELSELRDALEALDKKADSDE